MRRPGMVCDGDAGKGGTTVAGGSNCWAEHRITNIEVLKDVRFPANEEMRQELFDRIIDQQSLQVDTITGATVTSRAYLKSIEEALR